MAELLPMKAYPLILTHSYLDTPKRVKANSADPDQMPHVVSDQILHCLLTRFSIKNRIKATKKIQHPLNDK